MIRSVVIYTPDGGAVKWAVGKNWVVGILIDTQFVTVTFKSGLMDVYPIAYMFRYTMFVEVFDDYHRV